MDKFAVMNALNNLDERTPAYLRGEIFAHGDQTVRFDAIRVLGSLDPSDNTSETLRSMLRVVPADEE